jgi:hypothetical protein
MITSSIASSHYYYIVYLQSDQFKNASDIVNCFDVKKEQEVESFPQNNIAYQYIHLQIELPKSYGAESILFNNKGQLKNGVQFYWYDLYIGEIELDGLTSHYICYPYTKLSTYIDDCFAKKGIKKRILKPDVNIVLAYMKDIAENKRQQISIANLNVEITKYSAEIKEEVNANKINIFGTNPLKSRVFKVLSSDSDIVIAPMSLKLLCTLLQVGVIELSFDRLGNFRFWLKKSGQQDALSVLPKSMEFFNLISALVYSSYINSYTLLEDE